MYWHKKTNISNARVLAVEFSPNNSNSNLTSNKCHGLYPSSSIFLAFSTRTWDIVESFKFHRQLDKRTLINLKAAQRSAFETSTVKASMHWPLHNIAVMVINNLNYCYYWPLKPWARRLLLKVVPYHKQQPLHHFLLYFLPCKAISLDFPTLPVGSALRFSPHL